MKSILWLVSALFIATGCASSAMKERKEQRDRVSQTSRMFCEFVNGDIYPDIEVALNLEMAKRCDPDKNFSVTGYKTRSEVQGLVFCCSLTGAAKASMAAGQKSEVPTPAPKREAKREIKKEVKKVEAKSDSVPTAVPPAATPKDEDDELN